MMVLRSKQLYLITLVTAGILAFATTISAVSKEVDVNNRPENIIRPQFVEDTKQVPMVTKDAVVNMSPASPSGELIPDQPTTSEYLVAWERIDWQVLPSGGSVGGSASFRLSGSAGQVAVGGGTFGSKTIVHGFWQDIGGPVGCCGLYTGGFTGNTNCDPAGLRNLVDITRLIDRVYLTKPPLCCEEDGNTSGDLAGKINLSDITRLIDLIYIGHSETAPCL